MLVPITFSFAKFRSGSVVTKTSLVFCECFWILCEAGSELNAIFQDQQQSARTLGGRRKRFRRQPFALLCSDIGFVMEKWERAIITFEMDAIDLRCFQFVLEVTWPFFHHSPCN